MHSPLVRRRALVYPDYGVFQIIDCEHPEPDALLPGFNASSVGERSVYLRSFQTNVLVRLDLESWETEPAEPGRVWESAHTASTTLPSGVIGVSEMTTGTQENLLTLPTPARYRIRLSHRNRRFVGRAYEALFSQFEDTDDPGFTAAQRDLEGREQYLAQFWPEPRWHRGDAHSLQTTPGTRG
ncbi:hypothetical protein [Nocardiopsis sp. FIRDI 009]|uniref:hypothetical protein n=1 Tax=Nocardiopsis sp. FIRDI 009 TaxID=714197 RepID=UPI000E251BFE|nr:hypothetical protein [Nocardiopsis sp. FIRDI 009]